MAVTKRIGVDFPNASSLDGSETLTGDKASVTTDFTTGQIAALSGGKSTVTALAIVAGVVTIDCSLGVNFTCLLTANVTSIVLANVNAAGMSTEIDVEWKQDGTGGRTVAQPAAFKALGGSDTAVAIAPNVVTVQTAKTWDAVTWRYAMQESA